MTVDTADGTVALVYSGEAYNFTELRRELADRGHRFTTDSDTEVVLRGYLEWGDGVAERLNGMYAFAIWDSRRDRLVMIRDRMGIKPFYYHPTSDGILFGSEPKAILANPLARPKVTLDGLRELFTMIKTPGTPSGTACTRSSPAPSSPSTARVCGGASTGSWRPARTPTTATPPSPTSAPSSTTSCAASSSPTYRAAPCSPAASTPPP